MRYQLPQRFLVGGRDSFGVWFRELVFGVYICVAVGLGLRWMLSFVLWLLRRCWLAIHLVGL